AEMMMTSKGGITRKSLSSKNYNKYLRNEMGEKNTEYLQSAL
ncbi:4749_t:CDS:1, partial [Acaulospora colombiana]